MKPSILLAVNPWHGVQFFLRNGFAGFVILGKFVPWTKAK